MELKDNINRLMKDIQIDEKMQEAIMKHAPGNSSKRVRMRHTVVLAAVMILMLNVMVVGAAFLIKRQPLRQLFIKNDESALTVPEEEIATDIYEEIVHTNIPKDLDEAGEAIEEDLNIGMYGERIIDNDFFTIDMVEISCVGKELSMTYILTSKTGSYIMINPYIDTALNACSYASGQGDDLAWNKLPEDCGYTLEENQYLGTFTQLGFEEYESGIYNFYVNGYSICNDETNTVDIVEEIMEVPVEIIGNNNYGLELSGDIQFTEGKVDFTKYDLYISPLNVYLTLDGTYVEEMSSDWGYQNYHKITISFIDGTEMNTTVMLSSMSYDKGTIQVEMKTAFDNAIDPNSIDSVYMDGTLIRE